MAAERVAALAARFAEVQTRDGRLTLQGHDELREDEALREHDAVACWNAVHASSVRRQLLVGVAAASREGSAQAQQACHDELAERREALEEIALDGLEDCAAAVGSETRARLALQKRAASELRQLRSALASEREKMRTAMERLEQDAERVATAVERDAAEREVASRLHTAARAVTPRGDRARRANSSRALFTQQSVRSVETAATALPATTAAEPWSWAVGQPRGTGGSARRNPLGTGRPSSSSSRASRGRGTGWGARAPY